MLNKHIALNPLWRSLSQFCCATLAPRMTGMARKSRDSLHRGIPRLQWLRFVVALCVICTLITILHSLQLLDLDQKRWSVWPFPYIFRKPQPRPILLLTPRTTTGRAIWVREESYVRPVCKKKCKLALLAFFIVVYAITDQNHI